MTTAKDSKLPPRPIGRSKALLTPTTWRRARGFAFVAFITILLWVWADLERIKTEEITVRIKVVAPPHSDLLILSTNDKEGVDVRFSCSGSQDKLARFKAWLREDQPHGGQTACTVEVDRGLQPGQHGVDTLRALQAWDRLKGLTPTAPTPDSIPVDVDKWERMEATVKLRTSDDALLEGVPTIIPGKVEVRVPASLRPKIPAEPEIETVALNLDSFEADRDITREVRLAGQINGVWVQPAEHTQVNVTFKKRRGTTGKRELTILVKLVASPEIWERIGKEGLILEGKEKFGLGEWRQTVTIQGPREEIDKAVSNPKSLWAFVEITAGDLKPASSYPPHPIEVVLPPGLTLLDATERKVEFRFGKSSAE